MAADREYPWLMDVHEPTVAELAERLTIAEGDARAAREAASRACERANDAEEMAAWLGTISYEVICSPSKRVPRVYVNE